MGLIAGLYSKDSIAGLRDKLMQMINVQAHRDHTPPDTLVRKNLAIGMANRHDTIFSAAPSEYHSHSEDTGTGDKSGIRTFVDGIVLDAPSYKKYFENKGYQISSPACSNIVAAAYERWDLDFMKHLEGEFSCVVWDQRTQKIILARDPYGHKPLHYHWDGKQLVFSSEIKGIIAGGVFPEVDLVSLSDFLSLNCIPCPATIFKNIFQVPPGSMVIADANGIKSQTYWQPKLAVDKSLVLEDAIQQVSDSLRESIKKRMVSQETYCFLSGGIDSSAIVSFASELSDKPIHAISVGFEEEEENELADAAVMAKHVGSEHHQVIATPGSFFDMLDMMVYHHDSPFTDTSAYPTFYAAKLARGFTDIILTGDGPDQTMGGSDHYVFALQNNIFARRNKAVRLLNRLGSRLSATFSLDPTPSVFSKIERKLYRDSLSPVHAAYDLRSYFPDIVKRFLCTGDLWNVHLKNSPYRHPESWFKETEALDDVNKYLFADMKFYIPDDLMIKVDRMCMAHGLETLSPFQDINLSKIVNSLPGRYKINQTENNEVTTKYILKQVCKQRIPEPLLTKRKKGFAIPVHKWLKQDQGKFIREILLDPRSLNRGYFKKQSVEKLVDVFINNKGDYFFPNANGIVGLLTLELWHRKYLD